MPCDTIAVDDEKVRHWSQTVAYNRSGGYLHHEAYLDVFGALHSFRAEFHFGVIARRKDFRASGTLVIIGNNIPGSPWEAARNTARICWSYLIWRSGSLGLITGILDDSPAVRSALCDSAVVFVLLRFVAEQRAAEHCDPVGIFRKRSARIVH